MQTSEVRPLRNPALANNPSLQALCFWCETPHPAHHPLSVCARCMTSARTARFPMGSLQMQGPYPLTDVAIDECLTRQAPGNSALGHLDGDTFLVFYVGRSDSDVKHRLHEWVGASARPDRHAPARAAWALQGRSAISPDDGGYTRFAFSYASSADAAFAKEWRNYDDFGGSDGLDNATSPAPAESLQQQA
jgi:hypothetical protein